MNSYKTEGVSSVRGTFPNVFSRHAGRGMKETGEGTAFFVDIFVADRSVIEEIKDFVFIM